jgi:hypothetical protein
MSDNKLVDRNEHPQTQDTDANGVPSASNVAAHMPPDPGDHPVWANTWNPQTNEWSPSNEQHSVFGLAEPSHGDTPAAEPMPNDPGDPRSYQDGGGTPDARLNLLDAVRGTGQPVQAPVQRVEHVIHTQEEPSSKVRARVVRVQAPAAGAGGPVTTVVLEENMKRDRAILKCITTSGVVVLMPLRQGGVNVATAGAPAGFMAGFPLATGDPPLEVKAGAGVEAIIANTGGSAFCDIAIWEEMRDTAPGIGL